MNVNKHPHLSDSDLVDIHQQMLAFAMNQLGDKTMAEDAVQDALIKTMTHHESFKGKSAYKSWVFAILKNTIIDHIRKSKKTINTSSLYSKNHEEQSHDALLEVLFNNTGHWHKHQSPTQWQTPDETQENTEFWQILETCLTSLPSEQARVFMMREYVGLETDEICDECEISSSKFYVTMHRARLKLQSCLTVNWFEQDDTNFKEGKSYA